MTARTRLLTIAAVVWCIALLTFATLRMFWLGVPDINAAQATAYGALMGGPLAAVIGWYKWARRDTDAGQNRD